MWIEFFYTDVINVYCNWLIRLQVDLSGHTFCVPKANYNCDTHVACQKMVNWHCFDVILLSLLLSFYYQNYMLGMLLWQCVCIAPRVRHTFRQMYVRLHVLHLHLYIPSEIAWCSTPPMSRFTDIGKCFRINTVQFSPKLLPFETWWLQMKNLMWILHPSLSLSLTLSLTLPTLLKEINQ